MSLRTGDPRPDTSPLSVVLRLPLRGSDHMKLAHVALAVTAFSFAVSCDDCNPEVIDRLAPVVGIGDPFDPGFSICASPIDDDNHWRDCAFDFGEINIGAARVFSFTVKNPSQAELTIESIAFEAGTDPSITIDGAVPTNVIAAVGAVGETVNVRFAPTVEGVVRGTLRIKSNGENLDDNEDVLINFTGTGAARCAPDIVVTPAACDFGDVGVGATGFCDITINNDCSTTCELLISDLGFTDDTDLNVFGAESAVPVPFSVPCGTGRTIRLFARPTAAQPFTGGLVISSFDPDEPDVTVPLNVQGAEAPTCVARVSRINNTPNNVAAPEIEPLDDVELSADQSQAARSGGDIVGWQWTLLNAPPESSATLSTPTSETTRFRFSSAAGNVSGIDVAGTFVVGLVVTDDTGAQSTQCQIALNSVPRSGLHVQMTWSSPQNDIDLHLARNGTNWCGPDSCYFGNETTSWGATLDIDDLNGFGPENITIESPADGRYTVGVGIYGDDEATDVTVKIFIGGQLEFNQTRNMNGGFPWLPARVVINGGVSTVETIDTVSRQSGACWGDAG